MSQLACLRWGLASFCTRDQTTLQFNDVLENIVESMHLSIHGDHLYIHTSIYPYGDDDNDDDDDDDHDDDDDDD